MERGPIEVLVLSFPGVGTPPGVTMALEAMREVGDLRLISSMTVTRPADGPPELVQVAAFDDIGDMVADIVGHTAVGLPNAEAVDAIIAELQPETTAVLAVVEHVWAVGIAAEVQAAGGTLLDAVRLPSALLAAAEAQMAEPSPSQPD